MYNSNEYVENPIKMFSVLTILDAQVIFHIL
jgi:hypothetical protein